MNRKVILAVAFFIFLLGFSFFVYAAGSSTTPQTTKTANSSDRANNTIDKRGDCESFSMRKERIKCRLQNKSDDDNVDYDRRVPEACRTLRNPTACIAIYKNVQNRGCYKLDSREKDSCFKRTVNITKANLTDLPNQERKQKSREYLVLLLYELQERIEKAQEDGSINTDKAAEIIDLIEEIKQDILGDKRRAEIVLKLNELKQKIREVRK